MKNLIKALSEFQNECPIIHKDTKGHNYTYADLPQIFSVINPLLKKHKLCFTQLLENDGIRTILFHVESGEQIESHTPIPLVKLGAMNEYQSYGSGVTYFRRYALSSMLGLVTDKDTDASTPMSQPLKVAKSYPEKNGQTDWESIINDCKSLSELSSLFIANESKMSGNQDILNLLTKRKLQLS
jgi:hypothetical protein